MTQVPHETAMSHCGLRFSTWREAPDVEDWESTQTFADEELPWGLFCHFGPVLFSTNANLKDAFEAQLQQHNEACPMLKAPIVADVFRPLFHLLEGCVVIFHRVFDKKNSCVRVKYSKTELKEARNRSIEVVRLLSLAEWWNGALMANFPMLQLVY